jgi:hypothetical protein
MITNSRIHSCRRNNNLFTQEDHTMQQNKLKHERTSNRTEKVITLIRLHLYNRGVCCGARAIQRHMQELDEPTIPSLRTIERMLARHGLTYGRTGFYPGEEDVDFRS